MDKTIEIVLAVTVIMVTAVVILYLLQDEAGSFSEFLGDERQNSECSILETRMDDAEGDQLDRLEEQYDDADCDAATGG